MPLGEKIVELANVVLPAFGGYHHGSERGIWNACRIPVQSFVIILGALLVAFTALTPVIAALAVSFGALNISLLPVIGIIAGGGGGHCRNHRHCEKLGSDHGMVRESVAGGVPKS